jgi:hypothetical protein
MKRYLLKKDATVGRKNRTPPIQLDYDENHRLTTPSGKHTPSREGNGRFDVVKHLANAPQIY